MGLRATLPNHIPACRSEFKLSIMTSFSIVETVKEASAVCRSFLDGVVIFFGKVWLTNTLRTYNLDICPKFRSFFLLLLR